MGYISYPSSANFASPPGLGTTTPNSVASTTLSATGAVTLGATSTVTFTGRSIASSASNGTLSFTNNAANAGVTLNFGTADTFKFQNQAGTGDGAVFCGGITIGLDNTPRSFFSYNTFTDASNYERAAFDFTTTANSLTVGTQKAGTGSTRAVVFVAGGATALTLDTSANAAFANTLSITGSGTSLNNSGDITAGRHISGNDLTAANGGYIAFGNRGNFTFPADGVVLWSIGSGTVGACVYVGVDNVFEIKNRQNNASGSVKGKLTTDTNATTGLTAGVLSALTNADLVLYDASGQAYRVPCII